MKLGGMSNAINGHRIDTEEMIGAMTTQEQIELIRETTKALARFEQLRLNNTKAG
mgnify:CR=1 FL=1